MKNQIVDLFLKGLSLRRIAQQLNISHVSVKNVLDSAGIMNKSVKKYKDPFDVVVQKVNQIGLVMKTLEQAYNNHQISLNELLIEQQKLERNYCKWITTYEKHQSFVFYRKEVPKEQGPRTRMYDDDGLQNVVTKDRNYFYN